MRARTEKREKKAREESARDERKAPDNYRHVR